MFCVAVLATIASLSSCAPLDAKTGPVSRHGRVAFVTSNRANPADYQNHVVVSINNDATGLVELGPWAYWHPIDFYQCWSSDAKRLVAVGGDRSDQSRWIAVLGVDGYERRLMDIAEIRGLSLSADGKTVLIARPERKDIQVQHEGHVDIETKYPNNILAIDVESAAIRTLTDFTDIQAQSPVFSPDLKKIAFIGRTDDPQTHFDVYVMDADGSHLRRMTHNHSFLSLFQGLQWSPDSRRILYGVETLALSDIDHYDDIFVLDVASGESMNLTKSPLDDDAYFRWSPDGNKIAFTSTKELRPGIYDFRIYVMDTRGENVTEVPALKGRPSWLPDSRTLLSTGRAEDGTMAVVTVDSKTGEPKILIPYSSISDNYSGMSDVIWLGDQNAIR